MRIEIVKNEIKNQLIRKNEKCSLIADYTNHAYSLNKIIIDKENMTLDIIIIDVNSVFEKITSLKKENIIGRRLTEIIPDIQKERFNWIDFVGEIALRGTMKKTEQYIESMNKWFSIFIFSEEKGYFEVLINDITDQKERELQLAETKKKLSSLTENHQKHQEKHENSNKELALGKKKLFTNEVLLNSIINSTSNGILVVDTKGEILFINHLFIEMWKIPYDLFELKQNLRLLKLALNQLESPGEVLKKLKKLYKSKDRNFDLLHFKDGRVFDSTFIPLIIKDKIEGYVWNFNDIKYKKQNEERLVYQNAILNGIRNVNKLHSITNDKCKLIHEACKNITSYFGYFKANIVLFDKEQLIHKAHSGFGDEYNLFVRDLHDGKKFNCYNKVQNNNEVVVFNSPENECKDCPLIRCSQNYSALAIALQYKNRFYGVFTVHVPRKYSKDKESLMLFKEVADDISFTLKKIELEEDHFRSVKALKIKESRLDSIFKSSPIGMGLLSNGIIMHINDLFCEITGFEKNEIIGKNIKMLFATDREYEKIETENLNNNNGISETEIKWRRKDDQIIDILFRASLIDKDDLTKGITFTATDITEKKKNEADIKRLNFAIENSNNEVYIFDAATLKYTYVNNGAINNLGFTFEELKNLTPTDIKPEYSISKLNEILEPLIKGSKSVVQFETIHKRKNQTEYPVEVRLSYIKSKDAPYFLAIILDISKKKKYEKKLEDFETKFQIAFETSPDALIINRLQDGMYIEINKGFTQLTGFTAEDVEGKTNNDINIWLNTYDHEQMVMNLLKYGSVSNLEARFKKRTGEVIHGLMSANIIEYDDVKYILTIAKDITALKKAESALKENEEKYRTLVENQGEGIMIGDIEENIIFVNPEAEKIFELDKENIIGMNIGDFVGKDQFKMIQSQTKKRIKGKKSSYEIKLKVGKNKIKTILITATPFYEEGVVKYTLGIFRDITDWKEAQLAIKMKNEQLQATKKELNTTNEELVLVNKILEEKNKEITIAKEKAEESDRLKNCFLANISHEVRTPLNGILGFSQLLQDEKLSLKKQQKSWTIINESSFYLMDIMDSIMDISKIESGNVKISEILISLNNLLNDIYNSFKHEIPKDKNINFKFHIKDFDKSRDKVFLDKYITKTVFKHLIKNAIKFTEEGNIEIGCKNYSDNKLLFYVTDSGIGIPEKHENIIFERFRQSDESATRKFGGLGLGLPVAKGLVKRLGGDIWFTSNNNKGTTFYFTLPYRPEIKMNNNKKNKLTNLKS
ncbi:MAG: PAS domain S-box protein [Bacteroidales bacterium]|nr:PAS domain S-box protein [Bacteroidales bacterium]